MTHTTDIHCIVIAFIYSIDLITFIATAVQERSNMVIYYRTVNTGNKLEK